MNQQRWMREFVRIVEMCGLADNPLGFAQVPAAAASTLRALETRLGMQIFQDGPPRPFLTPAGKQYLASSLATLSRADPVDGLDRELRGHVRMCVPAAFAVHQVAKHMSRFHARFPFVTVQVGSLCDPPLNEGAQDLIIAVGDLPPGDHVVQYLAHSEVVLCASPDYLDLRGRPVQPSDLPDHALLLPQARSERDGGLQLYLGARRDTLTSEAAFRLGPGVTAPLICADADMAYASALAGLGICCLPSFVIEDALLESALERVLPGWNAGCLTLWTGRPARARPTQAAQRTLDFLLAVFGARHGDPWLRIAGCETVAPSP